jgi:hypothetical protein
MNIYRFSITKTKESQDIAFGIETYLDNGFEFGIWFTGLSKEIYTTGNLKRES